MRDALMPRAARYTWRRHAERWLARNRGPVNRAASASSCCLHWYQPLQFRPPAQRVGDR